MSDRYILYSAEGSGGVAVEAALTLIGAPYDLVEAPTYDPEQAAAGDRILGANPMRQVPTLVLPSGETMTESAAILLRLGELHAQAGLAPAPDDPRRSAFLRWMAFVSSAVYAHYWLKDDPMRLVSDPAQAPVIETRLNDRIAACWGIMEAQLSPGRYLLGEEMTMLDLYVAVVSRFRPRRQRFYAAAPRMGEVIRRVDEDPRLAAFWPQRYPFFEGWDRL
jgi:GST-like protein